MVHNLSMAQTEQMCGEKKNIQVRGEGRGGRKVGGGLWKGRGNESIAPSDTCQDLLACHSYYGNKMFGAHILRREVILGLKVMSPRGLKQMWKTISYTAGVDDSTINFVLSFWTQPHVTNPILMFIFAFASRHKKHPGIPLESTAKHDSWCPIIQCFKTSWIQLGNVCEFPPF